MPTGRKSFSNPIITREVSISLERVLMAPSGTTWSPTRVDLTPGSSQFPAGFRDLGAVVNDQTQLTITREAFQLQAGIPAILQYEAILALGGRLRAEFHSLSVRKMAYVLGNVDPINMFEPASTVSSTIAPSSTIVVITSASSILPGDVLIAASTTLALLTTDNEAQVDPINYTAGNNTIILREDGFPTQPFTGWFVAKLTAAHQPYGTSKVREYAIIGVADFIDGPQIIHFFKKARVAPVEITETYIPSQNARLPGNWDLLGYEDSSYDSSTTHLVIGQRWWFP